MISKLRRIYVKKKHLQHSPSPRFNTFSTPSTLIQRHNQWPSARGVRSPLLFVFLKSKKIALILEKITLTGFIWRYDMRNKKNILGQFFFIFKFFKYLEIQIQILVSSQTNVTDKLLIPSELCYFFAKTLTHYKVNLKHAITIPLYQGYCFCIFSPKVRAS